MNLQKLLMYLKQALCEHAWAIIARHRTEKQSLTVLKCGNCGEFELIKYTIPGSPPARILCAAIKDNKSYWVYTGHRHHNIIHAHPGQFKRQNSVQGFVDESGEFLTREEAAKRAYITGQIQQPKETLFSEDIY